MAKLILEMGTDDPLLGAVLAAITGGAAAAPKAAGSGSLKKAPDDTQDEETPELETLKKEVAASAKAGNRDGIKKLLGEFDGAESVSTLDAKHYPAFWKKFKKQFKS